MKLERLAIPDVVLLVPRRFDDPRGFFSEVYNAALFSELVTPITFVQDNQSLSRQTGTVRGLHFQTPPFAQAKLVRAVRGAIFDVAVDLRRDSPTFGQHVSAILSAENFAQLFIPAGFAHGFCTLEPDTEVLYKVDARYSAAHDGGVHWRDPDIAIDWPAVAGDSAMVSAKDAVLPALRDLGAIF